MAMYGYEKRDKEIEELKRFYRQQKSTRKECDYGYKSCSTCKNDQCTIREYVE